jgi:hypothetical protein
VRLKSSLCNLCLTSKTFKLTATPCLYEKISVGYKKKESSVEKIAWLSRFVPSLDMVTFVEQSQNSPRTENVRIGGSPASSMTVGRSIIIVSNPHQYHIWISYLESLPAGMTA